MNGSGLDARQAAPSDGPRERHSARSRRIRTCETPTPALIVYLHTVTLYLRTDLPRRPSLGPKTHAVEHREEDLQVIKHRG